MKLATIILLMAALAVPALAKDKPQPHVYDHTGKLTNHTGQFRSNAEAHVTVGGTTLNAYCNIGDGVASCSDTPGYSYSTSDAGDVVPSILLTSVEGKRDPISICVDEKSSNYPFTCDPIGVLRMQIKPNASLEFQYRLGTSEGKPFYCVPFTVVDKKGKSFNGEACYGSSIK
jgi:hypothetical protein